MPTARQGNGQTYSTRYQPVHQGRSRAAHRKPRPGILRVFRLLAIMLFLFLGTFILTSLVTGNSNALARMTRAVLTPGAPQLLIRDARNEYKISPVNRKNSQELRSFIFTGFDYGPDETNTDADRTSSAELHNQYPIQRLLSRVGYSPQTLSIKQEFSQLVSFGIPPTSMEVYLFFRNEIYSSYSLEEINLFAPENDGLCIVLVDARWKAERSWQGDRSGLYCFAALFDRPAFFSVNTEDIDPGELLVFYAEYLLPGESVTVQSNLPLSLQFSPYGRRQMIALAPISYDIRPGTYGTTLSAGDASQYFDITVKDKEFAIQYVSMDPQIVAETRTEETNKEFQDRINPVLAGQLPELLWEGRAALPVPESRVLTLFGARRYVNDDVNSYRHSGLDLEAPIGTEVRAVNNGQVMFADYLAYTGNTVLIEHGLGLKSWYYHMDELLVSPGDSVAKDHVIGLAGQTGFSAEPHLHLTLSVGAVYINPVTAINQALFAEPLP